MSTNFYWKPPANDPLATLGRIHVGLRSGGHPFQFQAFRVKGGKRGNSKATPGPVLTATSWAEWKTLLQRPGSEVFDEYDREIHIGAFIEEIESWMHPTKGTFNGKPLHRFVFSEDNKESWLDTEGYPFFMAEFS